MEIDLESTVRPADKVVFRELEGEAILLNLTDGQYYGLDAVGTDIWRLLEAGGSLGPAYRALRDRYDVSAEMLRDDLVRFVSDLASCGLIEVVERDAMGN